MNIFYPPNQEFLFLSFFAVGIILGIIYDIFKVKRKLLGFNTVTLFIDDFFYSLLSLVLIITSVFVFNNGIIRWYEFLMCAFGFLLYNATISKAVIYVMFSIIEFLHRVIKLLLSWMMIPISKASSIIFSFLFPIWIYFFRFRIRRRMFKFIGKLVPSRK